MAIRPKTREGGIQNRMASRQKADGSLVPLPQRIRSR